MAKKPAKKPVKKPTQSKQTTVTNTEVPEGEQFKVLVEGSSEEEQLAVMQHNIVLVHKLQEFLISSTMLDAKDSEITGVAARIILIDRKLMVMGSRINHLLVAIDKKKEEQAPKSIVKGKKVKEADFVEL